MRIVKLSILLLLLLQNNLFAQNCSINAGASTTICLNSPMVLNGTRSGLLSENPMISWSQVSGTPVIIQSPHSLISNVSGYQPGVYKFKLSIVCRDGYVAEDEVTITVLNQTIANAGVDSLFCPENFSRLYANTPLPNQESGTWTIVSANLAGISILNNNNAISPVTVGQNSYGPTTARWTIVNNNGCISFDEVTLTNIGGSNPIDAGPDQILESCFSSTTCTELAASNGGRGIGGQLGTWTVISGPSVPTFFPSADRPNPKVCNLRPGVYVFRYTVSGPCVNGYDEMKVEVPQSTVNLSSASANPLGAETKICGLVNTITLMGNNPLYVGEMVEWKQESGPTVTINSPNSPTTIVSGISEYGTYCFSYKIKNNTSNCATESIICYTFFQPGTVNGGPDQILPCDVTRTTIPTTTTGTGNLQYRIISGPSGAFNYPTGYKTNNIIADLNLPGTYRVEVNYSFGVGCPAVNDFVDIVVSRTPAGANAGTNQNFGCAVTSTQLAGNNPINTGLGTGR